MLIDLFNTDNYGSFNIKIAHMFGLEAAVYCNELINIYRKALKKAKFVEGEFFKLDREYVEGRTTISIETQYKIDNNWAKVGLIEIDPIDTCVIRFNLPMLVSIISNEDSQEVQDIARLVKVTPKTDKNAKRLAITDKVKSSIKCTNFELLEALREWVDMVSEKRGYVSNKMVETFQVTMDSYTKGNLDKALAIVNIATLRGYADCSYAIRVYEEETKSHIRNISQGVATKDTISNEIF